MINKYLKIAVVMLLSPAFANANEHNHVDNHDVTPLELIVYKTPTCGCCKKWITRIEDEGCVFRRTRSVILDNPITSIPATRS